MVLCLEKPRLQLVSGAKLEARIKENSHSEIAVEPTVTEHDNQAALKPLRTEHILLAGLYGAASAALGAIFFVPMLTVAIAGFFGGGLTGLAIVQRFQKVSEILRTADALIEQFSDQQIRIFPDVSMGGRERLDLWVRFPLPPKKPSLPFHFAQKGKLEQSIVNRRRNSYTQRNKKGFRLWNLNIFERMSSYELWLRQNRLAEFFGTASKDRNRAAIKLLVLTGETTIGQHPESAYTMVGDQKVLLIKKRSSIYVLEEKQLMTFIKDWVTPKPEQVPKS